MVNTALLIDGDIVAFKAAVKFQTEMFDITDFDEARAIEDMKGTIDSWCSQMDARAIICLSDPTSNYFRKDIYPEYKANRKDAAKPKGLKFCKEYLADNYKTYVKPKLEADDTLGILSTHPTLIDAKRKIIVSIDKDFESIPGWIFNPSLDTKPREVTLDAANHFHMYQTLVGDTTDNYKGCKGVGDVKAKRILEVVDDGNYWYAVLETFESRGFTEEDALLQARLARILRHTDYDFEKREVILWNPE